MLEFKLGDILQLKKPHPCGSFDWEVLRLGADIGLKCLKCRHTVRLERIALERKVRAIRAAETSNQS